MNNTNKYTDHKGFYPLWSVYICTCGTTMTADKEIHNRLICVYVVIDSAIAASQALNLYLYHKVFHFQFFQRIIHIA